ncbi:D-alanyl-D-alanine carboxypeptidase/D-alanyl-D-alanine-endopeptidase [Guyparkeria hydrothermalis]|uniref:D-alanyl-D-alanine carboxypeptidase/D-alanyl-D-alanine endopeptidase n=1 Tax=Guyparkeria hydrothermalis TaxID=923 RepID=UPI0020208B7C|nr:D-alanyl-D-alanine carboxypeptidase/D-alanyl-D-alanine-endopeptidase [Guyparkeria hydrothermalis]MCL7744181.1 D-alanyl-D-alanine carboxypeptidase/D-alanyl-D-alanine-endopeptidase [Guyparkeria hydrothermalis]
MDLTRNARHNAFGRLLGFGLLSLLPLPPAAPAADSALPSAVKAELANQKLSAGNLGLWVQAVDSDTPLIAHQGDKPFNPASVMKLVTTVASLDVLGPSYQWKTEIYADSRPVNGVIDGNLYIKGYGDPWFRSEDLWNVTLRLQELGVREIQGDVILDDSYFAETDGDPGDFDNRPDRVYNALPNALLLDNRAVRISISPHGSDDSSVSTWPPNPRMALENDLNLVNKPCRSNTNRPVIDIRNPTEAAAEIQVRGTVSRECAPHQYYRVAGDPHDAFFHAFEHLFESTGGEIEGHWREGLVQSGSPKLLTHDSRPLSYYLWLMNKWSNNVMARQIMLTIGAEVKGPPGTELKSVEVIERWAADRDLDWKNAVVDNGSGLSRVARLTPKQLGDMLLSVWKSPYMAEVMATLPIAGIDGTMRKRLDRGSIRGHAHIKTGTLRDVRAGAGFMLAKSGRRYVVVMLHNEQGVQYGGGTRVQDALLNWLYENG